MITEKILVVDDEQTVCNSIKKILSRKGYEVDNTLNVEEAIDKIEKSSYDLVITDLMMPKTSGMELLEIVKENYPELDVIMITGYASIDSAVKATKLGAADYLPKPFTPDELTEVTKKVLYKKKTTTEKKEEVIEEKEIKEEKEEPFDDIIDVDMPFKRSEVEKRTSKEYVETLSRSDIPLTQKKKSSKTVYCEKGDRMCRRPVIEGKECAGECPIIKKERENAKKYARVASISKDMIDVDIPFNIQEVERVTGTDYISCLDRSDIPRVALYGRNTFVKHSVLVVDDEPIVCHSLRKILNKQSCAVEEAFDVDAALEKMKLNKYDLVFLDLKMPKTSGMELLKSLKEQYPDVPVVMITGYASIDKAVEATRLGAFQFIPKPFTPDELKQVTTEALAA